MTDLFDNNRKFGFVTLCGAPNVGKSTLLNCLAQEKVSAVSFKPQTTRFNILKIQEYDETQIAYIDTPGIFKPFNAFGEILRKNSIRALKNADITVLLVDISLTDMTKSLNLVDSIIKKNKSSQLFLVFNKIDIVANKDIVCRAFQFQQFEEIKDFFMISAIRGTGIDVLIHKIIEAAPLHEWMYPPHFGLDLTRWTAEITMEKIFMHLDNEVPYQTYVETISIQEDVDGMHIYQDVVVAKASQKPIVIGKNGALLKTIGTNSRLDIAKILGRRVHLYLLVKVKEKWLDNQHFLNRTFTSA
ncbi:MAG: GTPase Era [Holosporales bacterium]|jgi:GTP-binding protein Era|nr:GTPase Era [Holosporales bacterium]